MINNYKIVDEQIANMISSGMSKSEIVQKGSELCLGWSYVWGGYGQLCNVSNRKSYAERSTCPESEKAQIKKKCQVLNGSKSTCSGCKYYPGGVATRFFDCRGFTRWILGKVGIELKGAGATSQWNTASNWVTKGNIADIPQNVVCCVFMANGKTMEHTGMHIGGGVIIHCSGEVKYGNITDRGWTHYAIPVGMDGEVPVPTVKPTLRRGSTGDYVVECQTDLIALGYSVGSTGADGKFGSNTEKAVKAFQGEHYDQNGNKLKVDGIVGSGTWWALDEAMKPVPVSKLYTVHIPHLTEYQANALVDSYAGAWKTEE